MDIVKVKIAPDSNATKYVILIHKFDPDLPLMDIKRKIVEGDFAVVYDLDSSFRETDILGTVSEYKIEMRFYRLLTDLQKAGAALSIYRDDIGITMEFLHNWIKTRADISRECEKYPD